MSTSLLITYVVRSDLDEDDVSATLEYCFEDLGCGPYYEGDSGPEYLYHTDEGVVRTPDRWEAIGSTVETRPRYIAFSYEGVPVSVSFRRASEGSLGLPSITIGIDEYYLDPTESDLEPIYDFIRALYDEHRVRYAFGDTYRDDSDLTRSGILSGQLEDLFWVNGFGPEMVAELDRDWLLSTPAWRVEECDDGGVFVWLSPSPVAGWEYDDQVERTEAYLGYDRR